jgi:hypothetical protein
MLAVLAATVVLALGAPVREALATQLNCMTDQYGYCYCEWIQNCTTPGKYCPNGLGAGFKCHNEVE